jgi:hypothetical protein
VSDVRVDFATEGHGSWLSLERAHPSVASAVRTGQLGMEKWETCLGFRIVYVEHPLHEKMDDDHLGKMVNLDNQKIVPPNEVR